MMDMEKKDRDCKKAAKRKADELLREKLRQYYKKNKVL